MILPVSFRIINKIYKNPINENKKTYVNGVLKLRKLLYITVNSKPENLSASKTVGRAFVNRVIQEYPDFQVEELDLYATNIPRLKYQYFDNRNHAIANTGNLSPQDQEDIARIMGLCDQFISADMYVIASPMWSLSFPAPLKEYIDCIVQMDKTVSLQGNRPRGLLDDKTRSVVYIQSSGGNIPWIMGKTFNKGLEYVKDIMELMGIEKFQKLLVDGTGYTEEEKTVAIEKAKAEINDVIQTLSIEREVLNV